MIDSIWITGANGGLGKETARQLALAGTRKIYLGCRTQAKADATKRFLEESTGKSVFETVLVDVSDPDSVRRAVAALPEPVEALLLNAGGLGGKTPAAHNSQGATQLFATNVLGHALMLDEIVAAKKLTKVALYAAAEAARGLPAMGVKRPDLVSSSADEFASLIDGSFFGPKMDTMKAFAHAKYMASLWLSSAARQYPHLRLVSISPGGSAGSEMSDIPWPLRLMLKHIFQPVMKLFGKYHDLETGAKRYVDALSDASFESGVFYGSDWPGFVGAIVDQSTIFADIGNPKIQDAASEAVHRFIRINSSVDESMHGQRT